MDLIANYLLSSDYDVVGLQELWVKKDFKKMADKLAERFPYSYSFKRYQVQTFLLVLYLYSGVMGSGLATFSRFPIKQTFFKRFSLNGEPHRIFHGDWFSGKGVGASRIQLPSGRILDFYNTHLHAEYDCHTNFYMVHRMCQLQELVQFVELSSRTDNLVVVVGDLNTIPDSFPYELLFSKHALSTYSPLVDTWQLANGTKIGGRIMKGSESETTGFTYNLPSNTYHHDGPIEKLDYIMVAPRHGLQCTKAGVLADDCVFDASVSLSDHCMVWAHLRITADPSNIPTDEISVDDKLEVAGSAVKIIEGEIARVKFAIQNCHVLAGSLFLAVLALFIVVLITFVSNALSIGVLFALFCLQPLILTSAVLALFMARVWLQEQIASLIAFKREWNLYTVSHQQAPPKSQKTQNITMDS